MSEDRRYMPELLDHAERMAHLRNDSVKQEEGFYVKQLTEEELQVRREQLVERSIQLNELEEEKKEITTSINDKIKPVKVARNQLVTELKNKQADMMGNRYFIANHTNGMMEIYDDNGDLIDERRLRPDEKQSRLFVPNHDRKTGTDN